MRRRLVVFLLLVSCASFFCGVSKVMAKAKPGEEHKRVHKISRMLTEAEQRKIDLLAEQKRLEAVERKSHFHNYIEEELPVADNPDFCFVCHGAYPHANSKMTRSILNMHVPFCACETCHFIFDKKERTAYGYRWYDGTTKIQGNERYYGTNYDPKSGRVLMEERMVVSKITPYKMWEGKYYMINLRMDSSIAQDYMQNRQAYTPAQLAAVKASLHTSIETKGRECAECHQADPCLDYKAMNFDTERVKDLTGLNIVGMIEKYQKFYIPDIFKHRRLFKAPAEAVAAEK